MSYSVKTMKEKRHTVYNTSLLLKGHNGEKMDDSSFDIVIVQDEIAKL